MLSDVRESTGSSSGASHPLNPVLGQILEHFGLARRFVRGEGARLHDEVGRGFLDLGAQYGALLLGHNPPALLAELQAALQAREPALVQPYRAPHAEALAEALARLTGLQRCVFTTSGAEAVEAALKVARAATGRPTIVAALGSYHGKTLGALAATGQRHYAEGFGPGAPGFVHVPFGDEEALAAALAQQDVAALLLEPIQGERGVIAPPAGYLARARALCDQRGVVLILDEIQTGLGRTGAVLCSAQEGVQADVLLLAKGLAGGLFPLGACLYRAALDTPTFALKHSGTFANHNLACRVGLAVLRLLTEGGVIAAAAATGALLQQRLGGLAQRYPGAVAAARGRGLFGAIELAAPGAEAGAFLTYSASQGILPYVFAAAAAQRGALVLPSLGCGDVLRLSPPLTITAAELGEGLDAVAEVCALIDRGDAAALARAIGATSGRHRARDLRSRVCLPASAPRPAVVAGEAARYAFLVHYTSAEDILASDPSFHALSADELRCYTGFAAALPAGVVVAAPALRSFTGARAEGWIIALPLLPEQLLRLGRALVQDELRRAVDLAAALGATRVGLGGLTVPYSERGLVLRGRGPAITSGNTLTALMAVDSLCAALQQRGRDLAGETVAVVGALGSVGGLAARLLARRRPRRLLLVANPRAAQGGDAALAALQAELSFGPDTVQQVALDALSGCGAVLSASSALHPVLDHAPLRGGTIICDVARPRDTSPALRARADLAVLDGGLVALPDPSLRFGAGNLQGLPPGVQLPCLSETILLALARDRGDWGLGDSIPLVAADQLAGLAVQHGFRLAPVQGERASRAVLGGG